MFLYSSVIFIQFIVSLLFGLYNAFPSGAPVEACDSLIPRHMGSEGLNPKESPYYLVQSSNNYGNNYDGHLKGIKGILCNQFYAYSANNLYKYKEFIVYLYFCQNLPKKVNNRVF